MKKFVAFVLCFALALLSCGCSNGVRNDVVPPVTDSLASEPEPDVTTTAAESATEASDEAAPETEASSTTAETATETTAETTAEPDVTEALATEPEFAVTPADEYLYASQALNVRKGPGPQYERVGHADEGELLHVIGWAENGWAMIGFEGGEYFISGKYLAEDYEPPKEEEPVTEGRAMNLGEKEIINGETMVLTFLDEFSGNLLNFDNWEYCPKWERSDRKGKWDPSQVSVANDNLILSVSYDSSEGICKSGAIRTKGLFEQAYGYFECSMKVQTVPGFWSAFWMMCGNVGSVGNDGVDGTEIDIMEAFNAKTYGINHALHWDGYGDYHQSKGVSEYRKDLYEGFHTYAMSWTPEGYKWYIDGELMWESSAGGVCNQPGYLKLTLEVGSWAGEIDKSDLPAAVYVDYVRVYQFDDMA